MQQPKIPRRPRPPGWMTTEEIAVRMGMSVGGIEKMTLMGQLPPPYQFGNRCVLFSEAEINACLAERESVSA